MIKTAAISQGILAGTSAGNGSAFLGVPYAAPPIGNLRWKPPQPHHGWEGVRTADSFSPVPCQFLPNPNSLYYPGSPPQSEDCLTLNIWTNANDKSERRPVMVWFHLGAFMFGSSACTTEPEGRLLFDGEGLADMGAVVVTVNYRLGRIGFLAHPWLSAESENGASGNYGFMDQVAALRWVRDNIAEFGGDPENVTIFGVSAGSASCSMHIASPLSRGLFHRAIPGSGGFMAPPASNSGVFDKLLDLNSAEQRGKALSDAMAVTDLAALRALPAEVIMAAPMPVESGPWHMEMVGAYLGDGASDTTYPIIDGYALPDSPQAIIRAGKHNDVPLLTGSTLDERSGLPSINTVADFGAYLEKDMGELAGKALELYPAQDEITVSNASGDLLADRVFGWQNWTLARLVQKHGSKPVYYYDWQHKPPLPAGRFLETRTGANHASEMPYIFKNLAAYDWQWAEDDRHLSDIVSRYWINFARTGDPNGDGLPAWPVFQGADGMAMQLRPSPAPSKPSRRNRFDLLDQYYRMADI